MVALSGVLPGESLPVRLGGTNNLHARWNRFVETARPHLTKETITDDRIWFFICAQGVFENVPVAGVTRLSQRIDGSVEPLSLLVHGAVPEPGDRWFDTGARMLTRAAKGDYDSGLIQRYSDAMPQFKSGNAPRAGAWFWTDDWEVNELHFPTINDLATNGFAQMLAPRDPAEGSG